MLSKLLVVAIAIWWQAAEMTAGDMMARIRLDTPLRSDSMARGSLFRATVVAELVAGERVLMPSGTVVHGVIKKVRPVGLGLVRERAWIELDFREYELPDGRRFPLRARLRWLDNAREQVTQGRIRGAIAASHPYGFVQGIWYQPRPSLLSRSAIGLTGASGKIWARYSLGPLGAVGLFALRFAVLRLPEPEIALPAGTEMGIAISALPADSPWYAMSPPDPEAAAAGARLSRLPFAVTKSDGWPADDIINVAFMGSREQVETAFLAAGWMPADPLTLGSFARAYRAFTTMRGYPTAPMALLRYEGAPPALMFQKSLNTLSKRHHLRIWQAPAGGDLWVGAATHDVSVAFDRRTMGLTHRIDPALDRERAQVVDDLRFAGCAAPAALADRPDVERVSGNRIVTDGRLAVLRLLPCAGNPPAAVQAAPQPHRSLAARITRRLTLEMRHYVLRGNLYYWVVRGLRHRHSDEETQ